MDTMLKICRFITLSIALICLNSTAAFSQKNKADYDEIDHGKTLFFMLTEDLIEPDECKSYFESLKVTHQSDIGLIKTYLAMVMAIESKNAILFWNKLSLAKKSIEILNRQVDNDPDNFEIRLLRFGVLRNVPFFLKTDLDLIREKEYLAREFKIHDTNLHKSIHQMAIDLVGIY